MEGSSSQRISVEVAGLASHIAAAIPPSHHTDALQTRRADISLSPSARTSYTRVDLSAADNGRREEEEEVADVENAEEDVDDEPEPPHTMPQVSLTFLLVSGRRRTMSFDQEITVGRVKELVWNAWPNEWQDERPPAPSYLRILYLGKILQDDDNLTSGFFHT
ncbi:hypothetical protein C8Q75DRAFT_746719 [Abortiporus biennis]|nr:hypothetical protein C8Q75DRAFT_746719 [Abortiporus biennis]